MQSNRPQQTAMLSLPGATFEHKRVVYTLDVTAIYPEVPGIAATPRFDAFRRNWLDALQLNPSLQALANNTASDSCAFCYYEFADIAALTPPLADGLTALDVVRQTLDRMLAGGFAYGLPAVPDHPAATSDTYPSMLIAAADCVREGKSDAWLHANYEGMKGWAESMLATDTDGNGLIKYIVSGNSGTWPDGDPKFRPSNWWDTIGFGYEDAYANALAYRSLGDMAMMAERVGKPADAARYRAAAVKLRDCVLQDLLRSRYRRPCRLAQRRRATARLLLPVRERHRDPLRAGAEAASQRHHGQADGQDEEVGYDKFNMGLPGNLISVALKDCVDKRGKRPLRLRRAARQFRRLPELREWRSDRQFCLLYPGCAL